MKKTTMEEVIKEFKIGEEQEKRMNEVFGKYPGLIKRCGADIAACTYLLTSVEELFDKTKHCYSDDGLDLSYARRAGMTIEEYTLYLTAREINNEKECLMLNELCDPNLIDDRTLKKIMNAVYISRKNIV